MKGGDCRQLTRLPRPNEIAAAINIISPKMRKSESKKMKVKEEKVKVKGGN